MNDEVQKIIARLKMMPLPLEGGFYRETWVSTERLPSGRAAGSAIYFLLTRGDFSVFHRLATEELWHFYSGDPVDHSQLDPKTGILSTVRLGPDVLAGHQPQLAIGGGIWQGARLAPGGERGWALVGCSLSPAWDEREFEAADRQALLAAFPQHGTAVRTLTR